MKILFLFISEKGAHYSPPLGLTYISSYINNANVNGTKYIMKGITTQGKPTCLYNMDQDIMSDINQFLPDIICMTVSSSNVWNSAFWAEELKKYFPNVFILWGGFLPTFVGPEILRKFPFVDAACKHEGEETTLRLLEQLSSSTHNERKNLEDVPNLVWRRGIKNEDIVENPIAAPFSLSKIKIFNFDLFAHSISQNHIVSLIISRGCPYKCKTKMCGGYWGGNFSIISEETLDSILKTIKKDFPNVTTISFDDYISRPAVLELFEKVLPKYDFIYIGRSGIDGVTISAVQRMAKLKFTYLYLYSTPIVESAIMRRCKQISMNTLYEVVQALKDNNIDFTFPIHIGTEGETFDELETTFDIIDNLDLKDFQLQITFGTYIQPGSIDYERLLEKYPDFEWFTEHSLDKNYLYRKNSMGKNLTVYNASTEYNYSDMQKLTNLPLSIGSTYDDYALGGIPFGRFIQTINYNHIAKEAPDFSINFQCYMLYIDYIKELRIKWVNKKKLQQCIFEYFSLMGTYLMQENKSMSIITGAFYLSHTIGHISPKIPALDNIIFSYADNIGSIDSDFIIVHCHKDAMQLTKKILNNFKGTILSTENLINQTILGEKLKDMKAASIIELTKLAL